MEAKVKGKPFSQEETKCLIELVAKSKIILSKETNAASNKMKEEEWALITNKFNATASCYPRTVPQLRLKWENLKKNARKRSTKIRMNNIKTGGRAGDYIPPDENLEHVISLLGTTATGLEVSCGGDAEEEPCSTEILEFDVDTPFELPLRDTCALDIIPFEQDTAGPSQNRTPNAKPPDAPRRLKKGKKKLQDETKSVRDIAVTEYYKFKKQCLEAKFNNLKLENTKLKLENEKLLLEIENLKKLSYIGRLLT